MQCNCGVQWQRPGLTRTDPREEQVAAMGLRAHVSSPVMAVEWKGADSSVTVTSSPLARFVPSRVSRDTWLSLVDTTMEFCE